MDYILVINNVSMIFISLIYLFCKSSIIQITNNKFYTWLGNIMTGDALYINEIKH